MLEFNNYIDGLKKKYMLDEDINSLEELYSELESFSEITEKDRELIFARTHNDVIGEYLVSEMEKCLTVNSLLMNNGEFDLEESIEFKLENEKNYIDKKGKLHSDKLLVNEYGTKISIELIDEEENVRPTRGWNLYEEKSDPVTKEYGDRKFTSVYKNELFKGVGLEIRMVMGYKLSEEGITTRYLKDDGSACNVPLISITYEDRDMYYKTDYATKKGESIKATGVYRVCAIGGKFGSISIPAFASFKVKIDSSVKILSWDEEEECMDLLQIQRWYHNDKFELLS